MSFTNELGNLKKICKTLPVTGSGYRFTKLEKACPLTGNYIYHNLYP
jgi:hypothetical protein